MNMTAHTGSHKSEYSAEEKGIDSPMDEQSLSGNRLFKDEEAPSPTNTAFDFTLLALVSIKGLGRKGISSPVDVFRGDLGKVWKAPSQHIRARAHRPTRSIGGSADAACRYIIEMSRHERLKAAGVLSGNFWLTRWTFCQRTFCRLLNIPERLVSPCSYLVKITAPQSVNDGDVITFAAGVGYTGASALNYAWTVSPPAARILSSGGTNGA